MWISSSFTIQKGNEGGGGAIFRVKFSEVLHNLSTNQHKPKSDYRLFKRYFLRIMQYCGFKMMFMCFCKVMFH